MNGSRQNLLPLYTPEHDDHIIDIPVEMPSRIFISEKEYLELKNAVGYWQAMHQKALLREQKLQQTIKEQKGQIRDLRNRLFGTKSEKGKSSSDKGKSKPSKPKRPRGQQPGSKGHERTKRLDLPQKEEEAKFPEDPMCPNCGKPYIADESKNAEIIEVEVKAYTRKIKRQCMKKGCSCKGVPNTITAPMPPKVLPKSQYGNSIWEAILLTKFHYCQPTNQSSSESV
jgi:transposase